MAWEERVRVIPPHGIMNVPYFEVDGARVWGATAMVLAEFGALLADDRSIGVVSVDISDILSVPETCGSVQG